MDLYSKLNQYEGWAMYINLTDRDVGNIAMLFSEWAGLLGKIRKTEGGIGIFLFCGTELKYLRGVPCESRKGTGRFPRLRID